MLQDLVNKRALEDEAQEVRYQLLKELSSWRHAVVFRSRCFGALVSLVFVFGRRMRSSWLHVLHARTHVCTYAYM